MRILDLAFKKQPVIVLDEKDNRAERKALSELRRLGEHIYIRTGRRTYTRIEHCTRAQIDNYNWEQIRSAKTHYQNTLKPVREYLTEEQLRELMEGLKL